MVLIYRRGDRSRPQYSDVEIVNQDTYLITLRKRGTDVKFSLSASMFEVVEGPQPEPEEPEEIQPFIERFPRENNENQE